ncbi:S9 family peptidase [Horticoccus sp. 23ND18S-11]|uniref:S9 family peptidase n=1 Tax=Horticoccus sp. 23ND18S-11 TaxID=3391832 RepID=UPI0039C9D64B
MRLRVLILAWCSLGAAFAADAGKRAATHEDVWLMQRVGTPAPSPDGKWAVFAVTAPAYDAKDQSADLWIVPVDGSQPPRQLTRTKAPESGVEWSPDSTRVAFVTKREGDDVSQIYTIDVARGGEAERVTSLSTGARTPRWSPDGTKLLFVSEVFPGAKDDDANKKQAKAVKERKYNARVYEGFPIKYWDRWLDDKQPHLFVQDAKPGAKARDLLAATRFAAQRGFAGREAETGADLPATWAPDGKSVVFVAATSKDRAAFASVPTHLFEVGIDGGEPRKLIDDADGYDDPEFRPDGKALLVGVRKGGDGRTYHHARLASFPWPFDATKRTVLSAPLDRSVTRSAASGDSRTIYFTAETGHEVMVYSVSADGGAVKTHALGRPGVVGGIGVAGGSLVATFDHAGQPPEIVRIDPATNTVRALTAFNASRLASLDFPALEHFTFTSARGRTIHNLIVRPAGFDPAKKYPLFVVIHGGPAPQFKDAWGLRWNYHLLASPGYVLLLTNYSGSSGYTEEFGQAIQNDPLKGPADEINQAADEAIKRYAFIDATRQAAGGASYGGHLANWLQATTTRYRCLISHAGLVNLETQWATSDVIYSRELNNGGPIWEQGATWREQNPVRLAGNHAKKTGWVTPMLLTVGESDFRVPANNTMENWSYHQRLQIPSKLIVFPDANHWITKGEDSRFWFSEVHAWLGKWLR